MKRLIVFALLVCLASPSWAAIANTAVWEIRTTGDDTNGGCYVTTGGSTDYSQQDAAQLALTDITSNAAGTTWTSATGGFTSAMTGNCAYLASGTNFVVGFYQVTYVSNTQVTVDRDSTSGASASAGNIKIGGARLTIQPVLTAWTVNGMRAYLKAGTYVISSGLTTPAGPTFTARNRFMGYNTTRDDNPGYGNALARPVIQTSAAITALTVSQAGYSIEHIEIDGNSTGTTAISHTADYASFFNLRLRRFTGTCFTTTKIGNLEASEVTACGGAGVTISNTGAFKVLNNWIHDNTATGISGGTASAMIINNIISNNTGASSDGITDTWGAMVVGNTIHGNGRDGIRLSNNYPTMSLYSNNILTLNGGWGINMTSAVAGGQNPPQWMGVHNNAFYSNTSGTLNNIAAGTGDVTLTGCPYATFSATCTVTNNDFNLNNTSGAGAACRAAGFTGLFPGTNGGTSVIAYRDIGAVQHQDAGGAAVTRGFPFVM